MDLPASASFTANGEGGWRRRSGRRTWRAIEKLLAEEEPKVRRSKADRKHG
jgi:hypothetical protein